MLRNFLFSSFVQKEQDQRKKYENQNRRPNPIYEPGDLVLVKNHTLSNFSSKLAPKRDGPYHIVSERSPTPTAYKLTDCNTHYALGKYEYHVSELLILRKRKKRGRPTYDPKSEYRRFESHPKCSSKEGACRKVWATRPLNYIFVRSSL